MDDSFDDLLARLKARDDDAAAEVFGRFSQRLIALARHHLDNRVRQKVDPEDVLQSVYRSFFLRQAKGEFSLANWDSLWAVLVTLTVRKCGHQVERYHAGRRDVRREQAPPPDSDSSAFSWQSIDREPTPLEAAMLAETVDGVLRALSDERQQRMVELRLQGHSLEEIAARVERSEQTVRRVLQRVRERLERVASA